MTTPTYAEIVRLERLIIDALERQGVGCSRYDGIDRCDSEDINLHQLARDLAEVVQPKPERPA